MIIKGYILKWLLRRRPPERISSSAPDYGKQNHIYVRGSVGEHEDSLLLEIGKDGLVSYVWWPTDDSHASSSSAQSKIEDVSWNSLLVTQEYYTWKIEYPSPYDAFFKDLIFLPQLRFWLQKIRDRFYTPLTPDKRMKILGEVIKRYSTLR